MQTVPQLHSTSHAAHPVWADSTTQEVRFASLSKRDAARLYHKARRFEGQTRRRGRQDGKLGRNGLLVLHALIFDCLDYATGRLDPSYGAIARLANMSVRSVARGLAKLKACGVLNWVRRCHWDTESGQLAQDTNAYAVVTPTQWKGYTEAPKPPAPHPEAWGAAPEAPSPLKDAAAFIRHGMARAAQAAFDLDEGALSGALGRLNRLRAGASFRFEPK